MHLRAKIEVIIIFLILVPGWPAPSPAARFTDSLGREVVLESPPGRVIALAPNLTEILYFLGLGDRVVGVTQFSSYPPEAAIKPKVGSYIRVNVEKIISLAPDLVIATADGNEPGVVAMLEQAGIEVYVVNPRNVRQVVETIAALGRICGIPRRSEELSRKLERRVQRVREKTGDRKRPLVFLQINIQPIMTVNRHTFHQDLIDLAGGINMARNEPISYPRISLEEVIRRRPEVILISSMERGGRFERARVEWMKWTSIPAVQKGRVHLIDSDLIDRPSPRIIQGLEDMARLIHPELNWE